jgi:hypothetical protein
MHEFFFLRVVKVEIQVGTPTNVMKKLMKKNLPNYVCSMHAPCTYVKITGSPLWWYITHHIGIRHHHLSSI